MDFQDLCTILYSEAIERGYDRYDFDELWRRSAVESLQIASSVSENDLCMAPLFYCCRSIWEKLFRGLVPFPWTEEIENFHTWTIITLKYRELRIAYANRTGISESQARPIDFIPQFKADSDSMSRLAPEDYPTVEGYKPPLDNLAQLANACNKTGNFLDARHPITTAAQVANLRSGEALHIQNDISLDNQHYPLGGEDEMDLGVQDEDLKMALAMSMESSSDTEMVDEELRMAVAMSLESDEITAHADENDQEVLEEATQEQAMDTNRDLKSFIEYKRWVEQNLPWCPACVPYGRFLEDKSIIPRPPGVGSDMNPRPYSKIYGEFVSRKYAREHMGFHEDEF
ncbi:hypothetical protein BELL_0164g00060 [Botrytis elliptica]|uniref:Uncharacterized protein n=1 Tax=Botrytis elliptica TaxID=278938 RepID=A0A4Z1K4P1_9HELO|nr:hypothetical protein EAE99_009463 [Botrytis elliptica]TGO76277.1 hypothetical protein BELL_0164g00060 [Botrytis elliptica]